MIRAATRVRVVQARMRAPNCDAHPSFAPSSTSADSVDSASGTNMLTSGCYRLRRNGCPLELGAKKLTRPVYFVLESFERTAARSSGNSYD